MPRPLTEQSPEELIAYIGQLRQEAQGYRESNSRYEEAFKSFDEPTRAGLLRLVGTLGRDAKSGAQQMQALVHDILGTEPSQPTQGDHMSEAPQAPQTQDNQDPVLAAITALGARLDQMETAIKEVQDISVSQERDNAYQWVQAQGVPEEDMELFFNLAAAKGLGDGDLQKTLNLYRQFKPAPTEGEQAPTEQPPADAPADARPQYPQSASLGGAGTTPPAGEPPKYEEMTYQQIGSLFRASMDAQRANTP